MRVTLQILILALAALVASVAPQKPVIVSYPKDTPYAILEQAKDIIKDAGGVITHEYHLIKAFAAKAPAHILETIQATEAKYNVVIEEDQVVSINGDGA